MDPCPIQEALEIQLLLATLAKLGPVRVELNKLRGMWECQIPLEGGADYMGVGMTMRDAVYHCWRGQAGG